MIVDWGRGRKVKSCIKSGISCGVGSAGVVMGSPVFPADYFVQFVAATFSGGGGFVGGGDGVAEGESVVEVLVVGDAEDGAGSFRLVDRGEAGADAEFPGG